MIEELLSAFAESGPEAGAEEIADILWLAARVDAAAPPRGSGQPAAEPPGDDTPAPAPDPPAAPAPREPGQQLFPARAGEQADVGRRGTPLRVARAASLHEPLDLMRALRAVGRRSIGGVGDRLDEQATVERTIEELIPSPVLLPSESRWLDLALVVDAHHSMLLWADLVDELRRVLTRSGVFRDVRTWYLTGSEGGGEPRVAHRRGGELRSASEIADPSGHRLILVVTDTVAEGWGGGALHRVLDRWSGHNSVAVLNVLPERLWHRAAARPVTLRFRSDRPASATRSWRRAAVQASPARRRRARSAAARTAPAPAVPMISARSASLVRLSRLVSGDDGWHRLAGLRLDPGPQPPDTTAAPRRPDVAHAPQGLEAVERFRAGASPTAQQLAAHLAAVPLTLPVITLVRRALLPGSEHGHLAEVALGGLFRPWGAVPADTAPDDLAFDFLPGVREALLGSQLRSDVATVREVVRQHLWEYLDRRRGAVREFGATRVGPGAHGGRAVPADAQPFADGPTPGPDPAVGPPPEGAGPARSVVAVGPPAQDPAASTAGVLLTPRLVLTCRGDTRAPGAGVLVRAAGRSVAGRVVRTGGPGPAGATLILTEEDVPGATGAWTGTDPLRLPAGAAVPPGPVRVHTLTRGDDPLELAGRVLPGTAGAWRVEIVFPGHIGGWPQLAGAPLFRDGSLVGLICPWEPGGPVPAVPISHLLGDPGFRAALERFMRPSSQQEAHPADGAEPDTAAAGTEDGAEDTAQHSAEDAGDGAEDTAGDITEDGADDGGGGPLCAALEVRLRRGSGGGDVHRLAEQAVADTVSQLLAAGRVDGTVLRAPARSGTDLLVKFAAPYALRGAGRLLAALPEALAASPSLSGLGLVVGMALAGGDVEDADGGGLTGPAVEEATAMAGDHRFRDRLLSGTHAPDRVRTVLTVSPSVRRRITGLLGTRWERQLVPQGPAGAPLGWVFTGDAVLLGQDIAEASEPDRRGSRADPPWPVCGADATVGNPRGCTGRVVPGLAACLAHLTAQARSRYLATLAPGAAVDFSGTSFTPALLQQLLDALRDPETGRPLLGRARFRQALFSRAEFRSVVFTAESDFHGAAFSDGAGFADARFLGDVSFETAFFEGPVDFFAVRFDGAVSMNDTVLEGSVNVHTTVFRTVVDWQRSRFRGETTFRSCRFDGPVVHDRVRFDGVAVWDGVRFDGPVSFARAEFRGDTQFRDTRFADDAVFARAVCLGDVGFAGSHFARGADFSAFSSRGTMELDGLVFEGETVFTGMPPASRPTREAPREMRRLVRAAEAVVLDFGSAVCGVFTPQRRAAVADDLLALVARRLPHTEVPQEAAGDPYAVLAALTDRAPDSAVLDEAEAYLAQVERRAVRSASATPYAAPLLRAWRARGVRTAVLAECSVDAVLGYLAEHGLAEAVGPHIYARALPAASPGHAPPLLLRAVRNMAAPPERTLLISASPAVLGTARHAGVRSLGLAATEEEARRLRAAGADAVVPSLEGVLGALRDADAG
ncbi:SAV_2336 N-terminal domain-related protein [Streptomyces sp. NPDC006193]|uniref:SAV_2336 N-terminal domain-related protein n=1 Tax=Streptomyces sp. NPDC006193 TaxID=3155717 RepID=UPI0033AC0599